MPYQEGKLVSNPNFVAYHQQDKLISSWLLSTTSGDVLSYFIGANTAYEIWSKASHLFVTTSDAKISQLKHDLRSLKKGHMSVKEYLAKIKSTCDLLSASGYPVSTTEQVDIVFVGLSLEFK